MKTCPISVIWLKIFVARAPLHERLVAVTGRICRCGEGRTIPRRLEVIVGTMRGRQRGAETKRYFTGFSRKIIYCRMYFSQSQFDIRFEWGAQGLAAVDGDVVIIVDILSFSTCVDIAVGNSATVYPRGYDTELQQIPDGHIIASRQRGTGFSLAPSSLLHIPSDTHLVLPSPNGSALSVAASQRACVLAGCLRNRKAVAEYAMRAGSSVAVIAAGERWPDGSMRVALEDMIGAGAIISNLAGTRSPEAQAAANVFALEQRNLLYTLRNCSSGRELTERGFPGDIELAAQLDCSTAVPLLRDGAYINARERIFPDT